MALMGSLIVSKQLAGCRPDPGLGNNLSFVPCPGGWPLKKKLQTSIFLFFPFLFLFLSFFSLLILLQIALFFTPFHSAHLYFSPLLLLPSSASFFHVFLSHLKYSMSFLAVPSSLISSPVIAC